MGTTPDPQQDTKTRTDAFANQTAPAPDYEALAEPAAAIQKAVEDNAKP
jgi:hypothetical protein